MSFTYILGTMLGSGEKEEGNIVSAPQINHIILGNLEILIMD